MREAEPVHDESVRGLLRGILNDVRMLIREEVALARVEFRQQAARARLAAVSFAVAAVSAAFAGVFLLVAIATGVAELLGWPVWAGFLTVALLLGALGIATLAAGRRQIRRVQAMPRETVSTLKENAEWIAKRLTSDRR